MTESSSHSSSHRREAHRVLTIEAQALHHLMESLDERFDRVIEMILNCPSKVIVTGMGKSGLVGRKISSTLSSTGTPSFFLHPAESCHGDLGVVMPGDLLIAISHSGEAPEMFPLINYVSKKGIPLIGMTGKSNSMLANASTIYLDTYVNEEACPLGLAPTSSSTATLALGDAISMAVLKARGFDETSFAEFHPGGSLGRKLLTRVADVMHKALPLVRKEDSLSKIISLMTEREVRGVVGVVDIVDQKQVLQGIITDGDIRRKLETNSFIIDERVESLMSTNPKVIDAQELAAKARFVMEQHKIQVLFVLDKGSENPQAPVGLVHIHDLLKVT